MYSPVLLILGTVAFSVLFQKVKSANIRIEDLQLPPLVPGDNITLFFLPTFGDGISLQADEVVPNKTFYGFLAGKMVDIDVSINGVYNLSRRIWAGARKPVNLKVMVQNETELLHQACAEWEENFPLDVQHYLVTLTFPNGTELIRDKVDLLSICFSNLTAGNYSLSVSGVLEKVASEPAIRPFPVGKVIVDVAKEAEFWKPVFQAVESVFDAFFKEPKAYNIDPADLLRKTTTEATPFEPEKLALALPDTTSTETTSTPETTKASETTLESSTESTTTEHETSATTYEEEQSTSGLTSLIPNITVTERAESENSSSTHPAEHVTERHGSPARSSAEKQDVHDQGSEYPGEVVFLMSLGLSLGAVALVVMVIWINLLFRDKKRRHRYDVPHPDPETERDFLNNENSEL